MCNCLFLGDSTLIPAHKHASNNRQLQRGQGGHTCGLLDFFRKNVRKIPQKVSCALFQEEADIVFRGEIFDLKLGGGAFFHGALTRHRSAVHQLRHLVVSALLQIEDNDQRSGQEID